MSYRLGRVFSDLSHGNHRKATDHGGLHHQSTNNNENNSNVTGGKAKQRLSLLFAGVSAWKRSDGTGDKGRAKSKKKQAEGTGGKRRGLDISQVVSKYLSMVEQLFASSSGGVRKRDRSSEQRWPRPQTFTSSRGSSNAPSKRHKGRLSSAPASLRGSPSNSGHLSLGESVKMSTSSSELSTMEELQSAIQAAIAHCKTSVAVASKQAAAAGDDRCKC